MALRDRKKQECIVEIYDDGSIRIYKPDYPNAVLIKPDDDARSEIYRFMEWEPSDAS